MSSCSLMILFSDGSNRHFSLGRIFIPQASWPPAGYNPSAVITSWWQGCIFLQILKTFSSSAVWFLFPSQLMISLHSLAHCWSSLQFLIFSWITYFEGTATEFGWVLGRDFCLSAYDLQVYIAQLPGQHPPNCPRSNVILFPCNCLSVKADLLRIYVTFLLSEQCTYYRKLFVDLNLPNI